MPNLRVRKATPEDISVLHTMIGELAEFLGLELSFLVSQSDLKEHLFTNPIAKCLIADLTESNAPIGYAIYYTTFSTFRGRPGLQLEDIFVREGFRSTGVGKCLIHAVCKAGKSNHCCRIQWEVPVDNDKARRFYDSLDVPVIGGWLTYRLTDSLSEFATSEPSYEMKDGTLD